MISGVYKFHWRYCVADKRRKRRLDVPRVSVVHDRAIRKGVFDLGSEIHFLGCGGADVVNSQHGFLQVEWSVLEYSESSTDNQLPQCRARAPMI